jgi:hypothetical protein
VAEASRIAALNTPEDDPLTAAVRARAFLLLAGTGRPVPVSAVGTPEGWAPQDVRRALDGLLQAGRLTVADDGDLTGSLGITVQPTRHLMVLPQGERYSWCALDALGIFGALGVSGQIRSSTPRDEPVTVDIDSGSPRDYGELVLLVPERKSGPVVQDWCPLVNFFADAPSAMHWADERGLAGMSIGVHEASDLGTRVWTKALAQAHRFGDWRNGE